MKKILFFSLIVGLVFSSCKKDNENSQSSSNVSAADKLKDTSLMIAREAYLWYKNIPANFNPRQYEDPNGVMVAIRPYSFEPGFSQPVDRWSFGIKQKEWEDLSSGIVTDLGMGIFFMNETDLRVSYIEPLSAAGKAGIQRSWQITKINSNSNINTSDASINFIIDAIYGGNPASVSFIKPDGSSVDLNLTPVTYVEKPLVLDTVYESGSKKIGYMVLNSFLGDQNEMKSTFAKTFSEFASQNVTDLVIDLRYNGGGYVSLQEELCNYMVPYAKASSVMYSQSFNDLLAADYNQTRNFSKKGSVNPTKIVFVVSAQTASASEVTINTMKPHLDVKLVGPRNTHGKPVGYRPIPVGDWYVFPVLFRTVNSNNEGNFFNGFTPDSKVVDGLDKPWGDLREDCLASAVKYLTTGSFSALARDGIRTDPAMLRAYSKIEPRKMGLYVDKRLDLPVH